MGASSSCADLLFTTLIGFPACLFPSYFQGIHEFCVRNLHFSKLSLSPEPSTLGTQPPVCNNVRLNLEAFSIRRLHGPCRTPDAKDTIYLL